MDKSSVFFYTNSEKVYSEYSDSDLYMCFCRNNWLKMQESDRRNLLNEVVSRENVKYGCNYNVDIYFEDMKSHTAGYQTGNRIFLNRDMFVNDRLTEVYCDKTIEISLKDSNWQALETVLHENRHVFQDKVVDGTIRYDEATRNTFASNGFTVSDVDGKRASQYMIGENSYALYYLNPTEIDAYKTSQERTQQIISELSRQGMNDVSADKYLSNLQSTGYKARLEEFKKEFNNANADKEVSQVLKNTYFNSNVPVDKTIESAVKQEMIKSQEAIDNQKGKKTHNMANKEYSENGFNYTVAENGTTTVKGPASENPESRKGMDNIEPDGYREGLNDKGHLLSARQGGPAKNYNVFAQDRTLNRGPFKTTENAEVRLANEGYDVQVEKTAYISNKGSKPDAYMINDTITSPDGKTQNVHLSFQNMSPEEQAEQNQILLENDFSDNYPNPDPLRESMTPEEYSSLMKETDQALPSVRDEFAMDNCSQVTFESESVTQGESSQGGTEAGNQGAATSAGTGTDAGADTGAGTSTGCAVDM